MFNTTFKHFFRPLNSSTAYLPSLTRLDPDHNQSSEILLIYLHLKVRDVIIYSFLIRVQMHMENMDKTTLKYFKSVLFLLNVTARVKFILWYKNSFVMSTKILRDYWALTSPKAFTLKYRSIRSTA